MKEIVSIEVQELLASGAFGEIYACIDTISGTRLAVKIEKRSNSSLLENEYRVYRRLADLPLMPAVYEFGIMNYKGRVVNCMTMELLGVSLEKLFVKIGRRFSIKTVFMLGKACLARLDALHQKSLIHRDIKPDNFMTDVRQRRIYLIDYGLSKNYRSPQTFMHIPYRTGKNLTGTARYASLNTHIGVEQSRRDDLESLGFMLVYFLKGRLPWQGLRAETKAEKYQKIKEVKEGTSLVELCDGLPREIFRFLNYVRKLKFDEAPDYSQLKEILENGLRERGLEDDGLYDWLVDGEAY